MIAMRQVILMLENVIMKTTGLILGFMSLFPILLFPLMDLSDFLEVNYYEKIFTINNVNFYIS